MRTVAPKPIAPKIIAQHYSPRYAPAVPTLSLRGSYDSLVRQNEKTRADGLERIADDRDLADHVAHKSLVPLPASAELVVNSNLPPNRRYCRPWTAAFLHDLALAHAARFHSPIEVSSAVRTVAYQKQLMHSNGNATSAEGDIVSPHLTGATVDIAKKGLNQQELMWMRAQLLSLQQAGKIDVEEEFQQACFHITVYKSYLPPRPTRNVVQVKTANAGIKQLAPESHPAARANPASNTAPASQEAQVSHRG